MNLQEPPERPKGLEPTGMVTENFQLWDLSGEACPEGTIPIRRTTEQDMLRASSIRRFGRKLRRHVRRDTNSNGHEVFSSLCLSLSLFPFFSVNHSLHKLNNIKESSQTKWRMSDGPADCLFFFMLLFLKQLSY